MDVFEKLKILTDAAKYDVACTSSGVNKRAQAGQIGALPPLAFVIVFPQMGAVFLF